MEESFRCSAAPTETIHAIDRLDSLKREFNEYLAVEWDHDGEVVLSHLGSLDGDEVFEFEGDGERYFAFAGRHVGYVRAGRMSLDDLRTQEAGRAWLARRDPVELGTSRIGDERVPSALERREAIERLIDAAGLEGSILEGLFLIEEGGYVALVESPDGDRFAILDGVARPVRAALQGVTAWQQLAHAVGEHLAAP